MANLRLDHVPAILCPNTLSLPQPTLDNKWPPPGPPLDQPQLAMADAVSSPRITTKGWLLNDLVESSPNFHRVDRLHYSAPSLKETMSQHEASGTPLIIFGWNRHPLWPKSLFNIEWLRRNGDQYPSVRNVHDWSDFQIPLSDFIEKMRTTSPHATSQEKERLYGKDGDCPDEWTKWLTESGVIPDEVLFYGSNDFLKFLPESAKVQTLMCYMGIGDTFTPFHKDLCASSGQNLMCYSENGGSSYWFMTKASDAPKVISHFHQLGHEVDLESHVVTLEELRTAPFDVYVAEQWLGDLVLVPPRSCHQVVNNGGITIKTSWSRMSLDGLRIAIYHELPIYHRVCRDEIYRVKSNIYHAMEHYTCVVEQTVSETELATLVSKLKQLLLLFDDVLALEYTSQHASLAHISNTSDPEPTPFESIRCDFCGADIFQSFFECGKCLPSSSPNSEESRIVLLGDGLVLCPSCYVEGRTCQCGEMQPVQCRVMGDLLQSRDRAVKAICRSESHAGQELGYLLEHPNRLLEKGGGVFESACKLHLSRQSAPKSKSCRFSHGSERSHLMPAPAVVTCKPCHASRCFTHLLERNSLHSVEVIRVSDRHGNDVGWHQHHQASNENFLSSQPTILEDEQLGRKPNVLLRLAHLAKTYTSCKLLKPDLTRPGWYDQFTFPAVVPIAPSKAEAVSDFPDDTADDQGTPNEVPTPDSGVDGTADMDCDAADQAAGMEMPMILDHPTQPTITHTEYNSPGGLSVLTELPSEIDDDPPTFNSAPLPICTTFSTASNNPTEHPEGKQKMVMDFVEVPRPEWYRKMRGKGAATPRLSRPLNTPEFDDLPIHQLARSMPHFGFESSRKADVNDCSPSTLVATENEGSAEHLPTPKRRARKQQKAQSSMAVKRRRALESHPRSLEDGELAFALNVTFGRNPSKYVDKAVQTKLHFTKSVAPTEDTSIVLEKQVETLQVELGAAQQENEFLRVQMENLTTLKQLLAQGSLLPPTQSSSSSQTSPPDPVPSLIARIEPAPVLRRRTPTEPRSDRMRRMNSVPADCDVRWNRPSIGYSRNSPVKHGLLRGRGLRGGGSRPFSVSARIPVLPPGFRDDLMANPVPPCLSSTALPSHSPAGSSQSSSSTVREQDCFDEHRLASKLDVAISKQPKLEDAECGCVASEDEVSLGDDDDVPQVV